MKKAALALLIALALAGCGASGGDSSDQPPTTEQPPRDPVLEAIYGANPDAGFQFSDAKWLELVGLSCDMLYDGYSIDDIGQQITDNIVDRAVQVDVARGLGAGIDVQCPGAL